MTISTSLGIFKKEEGERGGLSANDFAFGAVGSAVSLSAGYIAMKSSEHFLEKWGLKSIEAQTYFNLYQGLGNISNALLRGVLKTFAVFYIALLVPIIEEWFFRDLMYKLQESENPNGDKMTARVYRVIANGVIFGAFHFSFLQGWANILIVVVSTIAGLVFALLRELRGDRSASTIAHSLNNSFVLFVNFLKI